MCKYAKNTNWNLYICFTCRKPISFVIASRQRRRGNLNVLRPSYPMPIGHAGALHQEIPTVALLPRNDTCGVINRNSSIT